MKSKHPRRKTLFHLTLMLGIASSAVPVSAASVQIYQETFTNTDSLDKPFSDYGWSVMVTDNSTISNYSTHDYSVFGSAAIGVSNLNYAFYAPKVDANVPNNPALAFTTVPGAVNVSNLTSISWSSSGDNVDHGFRVAIQIGGVWYASNPALNDGVPDSGIGTFTPLSYSPASFATAANWLTIGNATLGNSGSLSLGSAPGSDLSGNVTAYGLYIVSGTNNETDGDHVRFDNFEIMAIPEPSVAVLGLGAMLVLTVRRRR